MSNYTSDWKGKQIDNAVKAVQQTTGDTGSGDLSTYDAELSLASEKSNKVADAHQDEIIVQGKDGSVPVNKLSGVNVGSIKHMKIGITSGSTEVAACTGFDLRNVDPTVTCEFSSGSRAPVIYYGRNMCDIAHIDAVKGSTAGLAGIGSLTGNRNDDFPATAEVATRYTPSNLNEGYKFYSAASSAAVSGVLDKAVTFTVKDNHEYLVIIRFAVADSSDSALAPDSVTLYNGSTQIATATLSAKQVIDATHVEFYAVLKPTWNWSSTDATSSGKIIFQDGNATAVSGDSVVGMAVVDLTDAYDDSYVRTNASAYDKYTAHFSDLTQGNAVTDVKRVGPYYGSAFSYFLAYKKSWLVYVPRNATAADRICMYIKEHKKGGCVGYIRTVRLDCVDNAYSRTTSGVGIVEAYTGNSAYAIYRIILPDDLAIGEGCLEFAYGRTSDASLPPSMSSATQTSANSPMFMYVPDDYLTGYNVQQLFGVFPWISRKSGVYLKSDGNVGVLEGNAYNSSVDSGGWTSGGTKTYTDLWTKIVAAAATKGEDATGEGYYSIGSISFQGGSYTWSSSRTNPDHTCIQYPVNSVNSSILTVDEKVNRINGMNLLSTLPTAVGTYKYVVSTEGSEGIWTKEEETVTKKTLDHYNSAMESDLGIKVTITEDSDSGAVTNKNYSVTLNDPTISMLLELLVQAGSLDMSDISPVTLHHIVQKGLAKKFFEYGDEIKVKKADDSVAVFQVIGIDQEQLTDNSLNHSMTIIQKYAPGFRWDWNELLFYASEALAPGTYYIQFQNGQYDGGTTEDGYVKFTTTQTIPVGGGFALPAAGAWRSSYDFSNLIGNDKIKTYGAPDSNGYRGSPLESLATSQWSSGDSGTFLGKFTYTSKSIHDAPGAAYGSQYYNYTGRNAYGSNNYLTSDMRKYITSSAAAGGWWTASAEAIAAGKATIFDLRHDQYNRAGWLNGFTDEFRNILGEAYKAIGMSTADVGNTSTVEIFRDKVFLLSNGEIGFSDNSGETNLVNKIYGFYKQGLVAAGYSGNSNGACSARIKFGSAPTNVYSLANGRTSQINSDSSTWYYVISGDYTKAYWGAQSDGSDKVLITTTGSVKFTCADKRCVSVGSSNGYIFLEGANAQTAVYKSETYWWMRSPARGYSTSTYSAYPYGSYYNRNVAHAYGCAPACIII